MRFVKECEIHLRYRVWDEKWIAVVLVPSQGQLLDIYRGEPYDTPELAFARVSEFLENPPLGHDIWRALEK